MHRIRIPQKQWGRVWRTLVAAGAVSRISDEPVYLVTDRQLDLLRQRNLPFKILGPSNGRAAGDGNG